MNFNSFFKLPDKALYNGKAIEAKKDIKDFVDSLFLDNEDKKIFIKYLKSFSILGQVTETTSGIWSYIDNTYHYSSITFIKIELLSEEYAKRINEIIQHKFADPAVVIYVCGQKYSISTALKRINQNDKTKSTIEEIQMTNFFLEDEKHCELFNCISYQCKDLKKFYESIDCIISANYLLEVAGKYPEKIDSSVKEKSKVIQEKLIRLKTYKDNIKNASSIREKMELNSNIKKIQKEIDDICR